MSQEAVIGHVRDRVLQLVYRDADFVDLEDVDSHVRSRDGLIRLFCERFSKTHKGCEYDVDAIADNMLKTLKWRKSSGLSSWKDEDFPLELWNANLVLMHEDDEYNISMYLLRNHYRISRKWSDLTKTFYMYSTNRDYLEAVHAGKKAIAFVDARHIGFANVDIFMFESCFRQIDKHFPRLYHKLALFGVPRFLNPVTAFLIKYCMPVGFRKRLKVYDTEAVHEVVDADHLPSELGGVLRLKPLIDTKKTQLKSISDHGQEWGLEEWEIQAILKRYHIVTDDSMEVGDKLA